MVVVASSKVICDVNLLVRRQMHESERVCANIKLTEIFRANAQQCKHRHVVVRAKLAVLVP